MTLTMPTQAACEGTYAERPTQVSPYEDYVQAGVLTSLQHTLTEHPSEMAFLITTQVMELWFTLVGYEWRRACEALAADDTSLAVAVLRRSVATHQALNDAWRPLSRMTPEEFNGFREALGAASGYQSVTYRELEFLLGEKSRAMVRQYASDPSAHATLREALRRPSLYDEALSLLARRGLPVPERVLRRDPTAAYEADAAVEQVWASVFRRPAEDPLPVLGEALTDVADVVQRWRAEHLTVVRRAMGAKSGSAGTSGVSYLQRRAERSVFPELWTARTWV